MSAWLPLPQAPGALPLAASSLALWLDRPHVALVARALLVLLAGAAGLYLMLPRGQPAGARLERLLGAALCTLSLVLLATAPLSARQGASPHAGATALWRLDDLTASATFHLLAGISLVSAVMMISSRNPVYCALWFAMVLLGNSGLMLALGAEFLSAATVIIYAGAIVVTFLFVVMLAQPAGTARYDRQTREPFFACLTGLILAAALVGTLHQAMHWEGREPTNGAAARPAASVVDVALDRGGSAVRVGAGGHVAGLGRALFLDHVVSVEVIGVLLLAAVCGAVLIAGHRVEHLERRPEGR